jgi:hypothetical protein
MIRREFLALAGAAAATGADKPVVPPYKQGTGWKSLIRGMSVLGWVGQDKSPNAWLAVKDVGVMGKYLQPETAIGTTIVNGPRGKTVNLVTEEKFGDCELYVEFFIPPASNSGVYLQGLYEVQIFDSFGAARPGTSDCGAIYHRWINDKPVGGSAPRVNASRKPGEWQSFHISFRAPRFDAAGKKTENARFLRVLHNDVLVQENVEVDGGTRAHMNIPEAPQNPLMLQGDHGPVAFRNIYIRAAAPGKTAPTTSSRK